jgi:hypothetical protein
VANFVKILNKGSDGRYRGKLPLIFLILMVLVIFLTNVLIKKREMMKVTQNSKELQRKFSRKAYAPKKTSHHQMKMKSVIVRQEEFYSWQ